MMIDRQTGSAARTGFFVLLGVCLVLVFAVWLLPKGFSDDLSLIGQDLPVVVLTHDKNSVRSMELMELLNKIRSDYAGRVEFLVVDINSQEGRVFSQRQGVGGIMLLLFDANGHRQGVLDRRIDERLLRYDLNSL